MCVLRFAGADSGRPGSPSGLVVPAARLKFRSTSGRATREDLNPGGRRLFPHTLVRDSWAVSPLPTGGPPDWIVARDGRAAASRPLPCRARNFRASCGKGGTGFARRPMPKSLRKHRIRSEKWIHFPVRCCRGYGPNQRCARESEPESKPESMTMLPSHLQRLEAESIHIMREVAAKCSNPVMLYSIGKDSSVMLHLAHEGVLSRQAAPSRSSTSTRPGSSGR